ncbi:olfactory receptor 5B12-like [Notamacropus eugenii]|uniref:olfactory receptor 5B12-like n=1 Tax=Notamacropus eugenii TaxID=9315 RepID=UPI003B679E59
MDIMENRSEVNEFILVGLTDTPELQVPLFIMFTIIYLITLVGKLGMVILILCDSNLHTPMYFFLSNLSLVDFGYSTAITPKVMASLLVGDKVVSYNGCATQFFIFVAFSMVESFLLAAMACDRHAAVCKPLHYTSIMTPSVCVGLAIGSCVCGFLNSSIHTRGTSSFNFCSSNVIHHFFCDFPALVALSCSETHIIELILVFAVGFNVFFAIIVILVSYLFIFIAILWMHSAEGRQKSFSTCTSHLTAVPIFYGTGIFMYLQPSSNHPMDTDKIASVFYTMFIPMLNRLVYSLRNKEVKKTFLKISEGIKPSLGSFF